jgi:hypothetical protein
MPIVHKQQGKWSVREAKLCATHNPHKYIFQNITYYFGMLCHILCNFLGILIFLFK